MNIWTFTAVFYIVAPSFRYALMTFLGIQEGRPWITMYDIRMYYILQTYVLNIVVYTWPPVYKLFSIEIRTLLKTLRLIGVARVAINLGVVFLSLVLAGLSMVWIVPFWNQHKYTLLQGGHAYMFIHPERIFPEDMFETVLLNPKIKKTPPMTPRIF